MRRIKNSWKPLIELSVDVPEVEKGEMEHAGCKMMSPFHWKEDNFCG